MTARQRKNELERLNEQLRKINTSLRKQARAGTLYAPGLTYIPPGEHTAIVACCKGVRALSMLCSQHRWLQALCALAPHSSRLPGTPCLTQL